MNLSVVIITKNEEENIEKCIKSVKFADEIIVIDDFSEDKTVSIASKLGAKVWKHALSDDFASQRNFGMEKAGGAWILFLDADERVSVELADEIKEKITSQNIHAEGFYIRRLDFIWGEYLKYGEIGNIKLLRLVRKNVGKWHRRVHEEFTSLGRTKTLKNPLLHYPHPTIREFVEDINRFSSLHAQELTREGKKSNIFKIIFMPIGSIFVNYVLRLGFLDGTRGLVLALMMSLHSFLGWSKAWFKQKYQI